MTPLEPTRAELRQAAVDYAGLMDVDHDDDAFVNAVIRLEVAAKAFADLELLKALTDLVSEASELVYKHDLDNKPDDYPAIYTAMQCLRQTKTPPGNHPDGAT